MAIKTTRVAGKPIIIHELREPWGGLQDAQEGSIADLELVRELGQPIYSIWDFSADMINFGKMVEGLGAAKDLPEEYTQNVRAVIVGTDNLVKLVSEALGQEQYGKHETPMFTSQEEALAYIESQLAAVK